MLSETTASRVYSKSPRIHRYLLEYYGPDNLIKELQGDLALHTEADDIAAYIIEAPGISYSEALVTLASDASISKTFSHSLLVPLRVLNILSALGPNEMEEYALTFETEHIDDVDDVINSA